jgi:hypothetical protein
MKKKKQFTLEDAIKKAKSLETTKLLTKKQIKIMVTNLIKNTR